MSRPATRAAVSGPARTATLAVVFRIPSPSDLIDLERYPVDALETPLAKSVVADGNAALRADGVCILPGFLRDDVIDALVAECEELAPLGHHSEVAGTPYIEAPDRSFPEGHPRRSPSRTSLTAVAYDLFPADSAIRALYEWDPLMEFIGALLDRSPLYRYADPFGALNLAVMTEGDELHWHFDQTDFVVSLAIQSSDDGRRLRERQADPIRRRRALRRCRGSAWLAPRQIGYEPSR